MKKIILAAACALVCTARLLAQEPSVSIRINESERYVFDSTRISIINPSTALFIGDSAGNGSLNPNNIIGIGKFAGASDTAGFDNVFIGHYSGRNNSRGFLNTFVGSFAGNKNDTGSYNTFVGYNSGRDNYGGHLNAFFGRRAGEKNISGAENTFIGTSAGAGCLTGSYNTFLGRGAGLNNLHGSGNVYIGYLAGRYDTASNKLIIANDHTLTPLVYGYFYGVFGLNAYRMEFRNGLENTIIGDNSGIAASGIQNVIMGNSAGNSLKEGFGNTFVGYKTGLADTSGYHNVFIGSQAGCLNTSGYYNTFIGVSAGYSNTSGFRNVCVGLSAGASNTTGSYNTYLGRTAGYNNDSGDSNVFIGNAAGRNEMGSQKLYVSNSETSEPLIYGDFQQKSLKFNSNYTETTGILKAYGEVRTDENFSVDDRPGISDTINTISSFSFSQNKLKYRSMIITGGIITYMSEESDWLDTIGDYMVPCGEISLIGEFNEWAGDYLMRRNAANDSLWSARLKLTVSDDMSEPIDSIIEVKFRENMDWMVSWGSTSFPSGIGTNQYGLNIPVLLDDAGDTTIYFVTFNCKTGYYFFENLTGFCNDSLTDVRDGKKYATGLIGNQCWMTQDLNVGTMIEANDDQADNSQIEKYCYDNLESNCTLWGGLYQWPELMQYSTTPGIQGICPEGWHVPEDEEFKVLEGNTDTHYGPDHPAWDGTGWRGADAGQRLRATTGWSGSVAGTDNYGFHAVPGGYMVDYNVFVDGGSCLNYQTSTMDEGNNPYIRHINSDFHQVTRNTNDAYDGCSVRCVKDK